jgi:hypothetical protein
MSPHHIWESCFIRLKLNSVSLLQPEALKVDMLVCCFMSGDTFWIKIFSSEYWQHCLYLQLWLQSVSSWILKINFFVARDHPLQETFLRWPSSRDLLAGDGPLQETRLEMTHFWRASDYRWTTFGDFLARNDQLMETFWLEMTHFRSSG